jgi:hypothetical protein
LADATNPCHIDLQTSLQSRDTLDLITGLERIIRLQIDNRSKLKTTPAQELERILCAAQDGDRRELAKYLNNEKNPITPDIRKLLIAFLDGKKRERAHRPKASATEHERREIACFVAARIFSGVNYLTAVKDAQEAFRCSDKKVLGACEKNAESVCYNFGLSMLTLMIEPALNEILRRGEPEYCERARGLLERWKAAEDELTRDLSGDDEARIERLASAFTGARPFSGK